MNQAASCESIFSFIELAARNGKYICAGAADKAGGNRNRVSASWCSRNNRLHAGAVSGHNCRRRLAQQNQPGCLFFWTPGACGAPLTGMMAVPWTNPVRVPDCRK